MRTETGNALHALLSMRPIDNLRLPHVLVQELEIRRRTPRLRIQIPDLNDAEPLLRADRYTHDLIRRILGTRPHCSRCHVPREDLNSRPAGNLQTIRSPADIDLVLPQRRRIATHNSQ